MSPRRPRRGPLRPSALPEVGTQRGHRRILRWPPQARKGLPAHAEPRLLAAASERARRLAPRPAARPLRAHGRTRPRAAASTAAASKAPAGKSSRRAHRAPAATANEPSAAPRALGAGRGGAPQPAAPRANGVRTLLLTKKPVSQWMAGAGPGPAGAR